MPGKGILKFWQVPPPSSSVHTKGRAYSARARLLQCVCEDLLTKRHRIIQLEIHKLFQSGNVLDVAAVQRCGLVPVKFTSFSSGKHAGPYSVAG